MNISKQYKEIIIEELNNVAIKMKESDDLAEKMYFFSAAYGMVHRIFNLEFNPTLVLIHTILNTAYSTISGRIEAVTRGQDRAVKIPKGLFDSLQKTIVDIADNISKDDENKLFKNLQKIVNLSYATTGNGYYLFQKGMLRI